MGLAAASRAVIHHVSGDMFDRAADVRVVTINCVGVSGAGVALAFKLRYPALHVAYRAACRRGEVQVGRIFEWRAPDGTLVLGLPTKRHWRMPSEIEDVRAGLAALAERLRPLGSVSVVLPAAGCGHGGLSWDAVRPMVEELLGGLEAEIYAYQPADSRRYR